MALVVAGAAWRARSLARSGAAAAVAVGTVAVAAGWGWGALLIVYFVASSALSRWRRHEKARRTGAIVEKGGERDARQVLANGGVFAACALGALVTRAPDTAPLWGAAAVGALAAAAADTWATEIGSRFGGAPRSLRTGQRVPAGTSGAVSAAGSLGAVGGAALVAIAAATGAQVGWTPTFGQPFVVAVAGVVGALADSLLGATVQAAYLCPNCKLATEQRVHCCGASTMLIKGFRLVDNDAVNFAATGCGAVAAALLVGRFGETTGSIGTEGQPDRRLAGRGPSPRSGYPLPTPRSGGPEIAMIWQGPSVLSARQWTESSTPAASRRDVALDIDA